MRRVISYGFVVLALATAIGVLVPLFGFGLPFGASAKVDPTGPAQSVNRTLKGNRLPIPMSVEKRQPAPKRSPTAPKPPTIMVGCDPVFSPLSASAHANFPGRCVA